MILHRLILAAGVAAALMADRSMAQDPSQQQPSRANGGQGNWGGGRGRWMGPNGGNSGGDGSSQVDGNGNRRAAGNPADRLRRFDTNGDGIIEPSELNDRNRRFVTGMAQRAGMDPNAPMPIEKLSAAAEEGRRDRQEPTDPSRATPATANPAAAKPPETKDAKPAVARLVPGFGEPTVITPVPGFGLAVALSTAATTANPSATASTNSGPAARDNGGGDDYNGPLLGNRSSSSSSGHGGSTNKPSRYLSPAERLPEGTPSWFVRADLDGDGQVSMAEFASHWSDGELSRFAKYDLNGDGVITPQECLQVDKPSKK